MMRRLIDSFLKRVEPSARLSFAQCGEDVLISFLVEALGIRSGTYIDIGANDPRHFSNSYLFYRKGWTGICVEPQSHLCDEIRRLRPRDAVANCGLGLQSGKLNFFEISPNTLSTFDAEVAKRYEAVGHRIVNEREIPVLSVKEFLQGYPALKQLDIMSIDIEGDEVPIVREFVHAGLKPKVLICETRDYAPVVGGGRKDQRKMEELTALGYSVYADTYINTVFLDQALLPSSE